RPGQLDRRRATIGKLLDPARRDTRRDRFRCVRAFTEQQKPTGAQAAGGAEPGARRRAAERGPSADAVERGAGWAVEWRRTGARFRTGCPWCRRSLTRLALAADVAGDRRRLIDDEIELHDDPILGSEDTEERRRGVNAVVRHEDRERALGAQRPVALLLDDHGHTNDAL